MEDVLVRPAQTAVSPLGASEVDALVRAHLPLVRRIVRETLGRVPAHVGRDDLVSAGMYALARAAQSFDRTHGVAFATYAALRIRGALTDELRGRDWASRSVRTRAREVEQVRSRLADTLGRTPTRDEIADAMSIPARALDRMEADVHRAAVVSLHALTSEAGDEPVLDTADQPEALLVRREQLGYLRDAVAELPERLRIVVQGYFFDQRRMTDIAAELGVTESRVSQLRSEALALLREGMRASEADDSPRAAITRLDRSRGRAAIRSRTAYFAAVAARSTVASRLDATTLLGEPRPAVPRPSRARHLAPHALAACGQ